MAKMDGTEFYKNWYELWTKQSQEFFDTANKNLKNVFNKTSKFDAQENLEQLNVWLEELKKQWQFKTENDQAKDYSSYGKMMSDMFNEAAAMLTQQWQQRARAQDPIKNAQELYEMWLNCCHEIYQKAMKTSAYQEAYADFMSQALKFWKNYMPKNEG